jgi:hypothetical protein
VFLVIVTVILVIFNFTVIKPSIKWGNKVRADWEKTGYDSTWVAFTQESVNVIVRSIEEYKHKYNEYPDNLSEINNIFIDNHDYSYRLKDSNGHVNGIPFYYERVDSNKFFFASVGKDGIIKTEDDLLPQISIEQEKTSGLIKYVIKTFTQEEIENEKNSVNINKVIKAIEKGDKKVFPNRKLN